MKRREPSAAEILAALPTALPVFPLTGIVLLPGGRLPLNIFEPRYLAMVDDALGQGRMIGIIQPTTEEDAVANPPLYHVGCAGRIVSFSETDDGRYLINLQGLCRFHVAEELAPQSDYRRVKPDWRKFVGDVGPEEEGAFDRDRLMAALRPYFKAQDIAADWNAVQNTSDETLISSLTMICPLEPSEKQALLEARSLRARAKLLIALLEMASLPQQDAESVRH